MSRDKLVSLEVWRARARDPDVEAWNLGGRRWYMEPFSTSRIGDLRRGAWLMLADECEDYARLLREHVGVGPQRQSVHPRRHRVRRRR